jgi:large subunit ribosomal protein L3
VSIGILGNKIGMTQIFDEKGLAIPVTLIKVGPCVITQIKNLSTDGYNAVQLGFSLLSDKMEELKKEKLNKPQLGHFKKAGTPFCKYVREYRIDEPNNFSLGQKIDSNNFSCGQLIDVCGKSIGKGFAGTVKRYKFGRGPMTHGSKNHRAPGSIGSGTTPGRVYPGKRMAGRLGGKNTTVKRIKILKIDSKENILVVKGAVPGKPGNLVSIKPSTY